MEERFKSLSIFEFQARFPDESACMKYLTDLKWATGYSCSKCGHVHYCKGNSPEDRQCTRCRYVESASAGTLFHGCKFSALKAFYIVYYVSTSKNGISSTELSRKLALRQKTCWLFKKKVMKAMESSRNLPMSGKVDVDETYVGEEDRQCIGRKRGNKKIVVISIERNEKGVSRMYGRVITAASKKNLHGFMIDHINPKANVRTDQWSGYQGLEGEFPNIIREKSEKMGKNFSQIHRCIMMFKAWLRGVHHSVKHLQSYIDEYTYRFNRHKMKEGIFENLMTRMVKKPPFTYKMIIS